MKNCSLRKRLTLEKFVLDCPCGSDLMLEQVKSGRCPVPGQEQAENSPQSPFPSLFLAMREQVENFGVKLRLGKKSAGEGVPKLSFYFSSSYSDFFGNKLISSSYICFACGSTWWVISLCSYLEPWDFWYSFSPLSTWGGKWQSSFGGHLVFSQGEPTIRRHSIEDWKVLSMHEAFHSLRLTSLCFVFIKLMWSCASPGGDKLCGRKLWTTHACNCEYLKGDLGLSVCKVLAHFVWVLLNLPCYRQWITNSFLFPSLPLLTLCSPWNQWIFNIYD